MLFRNLCAIALSAALLCAQSVSVVAETKRSAHVKIENQSGRQIDGVYVVHKYSDEYRDVLQFGKIAHGGLGLVSSRSPDKTVRYYTGVFTTGKDWWQVSWYYRDGDDYMMRTTDPSNGQCPINFIERITQRVAPIALSHTPALVDEIGQEILSRAMNHTSTCGFKQHILRSEDANQNTTIRIGAGGRVDFLSRSGKSSTVSTPRKLASLNNTPMPTPMANGGFIAASANSAKCLHKQSDDFNNGNIIHLWDCTAGPVGNKSWVFDDRSGYIRSTQNVNKCLHKRDEGWQNGNPIHLWDCDAGPAANKQWYLDAQTGYIRSKANTGKCLHKQSNGFANGNRIHLWDCAQGPTENKTWRVTQ